MPYSINGIGTTVACPACPKSVLPAPLVLREIEGRVLWAIPSRTITEFFNHRRTEDYGMSFETRFR